MTKEEQRDKILGQVFDQLQVTKTLLHYGKIQEAKASVVIAEEDVLYLWKTLPKN